MIYDWQPELPALAGLSNEETAEAINAMTVPYTVESISGQDIFEATTQADYAALTAAQKSLYHAIISMASIQVSGTNTRAALLAMFPAGTATRANLAALQTETRRKYAMHVGPHHVADARSLP